jgi:chromosome segregation ATPase
VKTPQNIKFDCENASKSKSKSQNTTTDDGGDEYISLSTVKELMAQKENAFKVMIDSLIKSTTSRVDGLVKELAELKYSLEYSQKDIASQQKELDRNQSEIQSMSNEISNIKMSLDKYSTKTVDLENRSRRNNIRVTGIPEKRSETRGMTRRQWLNLSLKRS